MSIESFIKRISVQVAVYWGAPHTDGYGGFTYGTPIEIKCRWDDLTKVINNTGAEELISNTQIMTPTILELGGCLYLGTLADLEDSTYAILLDSGQAYPYPSQVEKAYKITSKDVTPLIRSTTRFVRIYYLKPNWETKV